MAGFQITAPVIPSQIAAAGGVLGGANLTTQYRGVFVSAAGTVTESSTIVTDSSGRLGVAGNVLIGTTTPYGTEKLGVNGEVYFNAATGALRSDANGWAIGATPLATSKLRINGEILILGGTITQPGLQVGDINSGIYAPAAGIVGCTINGTEAWRTDTSRNILIGTTTQYSTEKLGVNGSVYVNGDLQLPATTFTSQIGVVKKGGSRFIHDFNYGNNGTVTTAGFNTFVGINAGNFTMGSTATTTTQASYNTASGYSSLFSNTTGHSNTASGYSSLFSNTAGHSNTASGHSSGRYIADGSSPNQTSNTSIYLGASTKASADGNSNETVIGYNAIGNGSNSVTLGNASVTKTVLRGNVITSPLASVTPANNGELMVEATSNTTLTFKLKGTDGTVRSGTITLA